MELKGEKFQGFLFTKVGKSLKDLELLFKAQSSNSS